MSDEDAPQTRLRVGRWLPEHTAVDGAGDQEHPGGPPYRSGEPDAESGSVWVSSSAPGLRIHRADRPMRRALLVGGAIMSVLVAVSGYIIAQSSGSHPQIVLPSTADQRTGGQGSPAQSPTVEFPTYGTGPGGQAVPSQPAASWTSSADTASASPQVQQSTQGGSGQPILTVTPASVPEVVDLSTEGTLDWIHWGLRDSRSVDRKRGGSGAIVEPDGQLPRGRYANNPQGFSWRDGNPTRTATRTPTGVYACGVGNGFTLTVPAGAQARTLRLYAGVWRARGKLEVSLPADGVTATASLENGGAIQNTQFTITFRASKGGSLQVHWATELSFDWSCGNVNMQAATLR
jgi:hypothetical protein